MGRRKELLKRKQKKSKLLGNRKQAFSALQHQPRYVESQNRQWRRLVGRLSFSRSYFKSKSGLMYLFWGCERLTLFHRFRQSFNTSRIQITCCVSFCSKNERNKRTVEGFTNTQNYSDETGKDVKRRRCDDRWVSAPQTVTRFHLQWFWIGELRCSAAERGLSADCNVFYYNISAYVFVS